LEGEVRYGQTPVSGATVGGASTSADGDVTTLDGSVNAFVDFEPGLDGIRPYLGAGINWTIFFDESTQGALAVSRLKLDDSFGIALQGGFDVQLNESWFLNFDLRWADIDTDAEVDGVSIGTVEIDPVIYALNVGYRF